MAAVFLFQIHRTTHLYAIGISDGDAILITADHSFGDFYRQKGFDRSTVSKLFLILFPFVFFEPVAESGCGQFLIFTKLVLG
jgi:hypothetical protein